MEWNDEKCLSLIDIYKNTRILWDPKDSNYFKKHLKEDAWAEIGVAMDTTGDICKQKMVTLLASYRREKMKIKKSTGTGKGREDVYESKWYAFNAFNFLRDRDTPRKGITTETIEDATTTETTEEISTQEDNTNAPTPKKAKSDPKLQLLKEAFGILKSAATNNTPPQSDNENCEIKAFLNFLHQKMKSYSNHTKNMVQHEICQMVFKADQGVHDHSQQQYGFHSSPPPFVSNVQTLLRDSSSVQQQQFASFPQSSASTSSVVPTPQASPSTSSCTSVGCSPSPQPHHPYESTQQVNRYSQYSTDNYNNLSPSQSEYSDLDITELI